MLRRVQRCCKVERALDGIVIPLIPVLYKLKCKYGSAPCVDYEGRSYIYMQLACESRVRRAREVEVAEFRASCVEYRISSLDLVLLLLSDGIYVVFVFAVSVARVGSGRIVVGVQKVLNFVERVVVETFNV